LITILAHDLRIPLTPLGGRINMLQLRAEREAHEANRRDAIAMQQAVEHLDQIIGDLLDTSRLEQGIFELDRKETDLVALIRQCITTIEDPAFAIELSAPPQLIAMIDPARIRQVLENLLNNARVHARSTVPVRLEASLETGDDGDCALLSIRDFGPGIPSDLLPRIFSRFSFGRGSRGLGLGLYLARGITVAHGGTLTVESELGHGSTFHLRLPTTSRS
jgi:two-component system, OmpR family, sensor kinase